MEEKIYERQVQKQSLSSRVVDEHQIERHFSSNDLQELYSFRPDRLDDPNQEEKPTPILPKVCNIGSLPRSNLRGTHILFNVSQLLFRQMYVIFYLQIHS